MPVLDRAPDTSPKAEPESRTDEVFDVDVVRREELNPFKPLEDLEDIELKTFKIVREEELSPQDFLDLITKDRRAIKQVQIVPAQPGGLGFGRFLVSYATPRIRRSR